MKELLYFGLSGAISGFVLVLVFWAKDSEWRILALWSVLCMLAAIVGAIMSTRAGA